MTDPDDGQKWPEGLTEEDGKLYRNGKLLVPESRVLELCEAWHHHMMHPGFKRQAPDMQLRFEVDDIGLYNAIKQIKKGCSLCQACNPDNRSHQGEAQWTLIPDQPMESVAMDVLFMPEVHIGKEAFDCVVVCVDRHSGYVVAVPARKKGVASQGGCGHYDSSLADRLLYPPYHLQRPKTPVHRRLVQGYVRPYGDTPCQEHRLPQPVRWPS